MYALERCHGLDLARVMRMHRPGAPAGGDIVQRNAGPHASTLARRCVGEQRRSYSNDGRAAVG